VLSQTDLNCLCSFDCMRIDLEEKYVLYFSFFCSGTQLLIEFLNFFKRPLSGAHVYNIILCNLQNCGESCRIFTFSRSGRSALKIGHLYTRVWAIVYSEHMFSFKTHFSLFHHRPMAMCDVHNNMFTDYTWHDIIYYIICRLSVLVFRFYNWTRFF